MNNELYLKRFFIEVYNDESMYYDYLNNKVFLNYDEFAKWHKDIELRNSMFANSIKEFDRIDFKDIIVESKLSEELNISKHFHNKSEGQVSEFGKFEIKSYPLGNDNKHYICNGYFTDTLEQIYKVLDKGAFTVGICTEKKTELFHDVVKYYGELRSFLLKSGYQTSALEVSCNSKNRIYMLMYNCKMKRR